MDSIGSTKPINMISQWILEFLGTNWIVNIYIHMLLVFKKTSSVVGCFEKLEKNKEA